MGLGYFLSIRYKCPQHAEHDESTETASSDPSAAPTSDLLASGVRPRKDAGLPSAAAPDVLSAASHATPSAEGRSASSAASLAECGAAPPLTSLPGSSGCPRLRWTALSAAHKFNITQNM